jgi:hypothetical protein
MTAGRQGSGYVPLAGNRTILPPFLTPDPLIPASRWEVL